MRAGGRWVSLTLNPAPSLLGEGPCARMLEPSPLSSPEGEKGNEKLMKRKITVFALSAMLVAFCGSVDAQRPEKVPRIGFLSPFSPSATALWLDAFRQGLRDLGWIEGKNINIEYR